MPCGARWDKAVAYRRQAGDKAVARSAGREAVACFEQALVAVEHLPEGRARQEQAIDVRFGLRHALGQRLENDRILTHLREAEGLAQALGDQHRLGLGCGLRPLVLGPQATCHAPSRLASAPSPWPGPWRIRHSRS